MNNLLTGRNGEDLAVAYLQQHDFTILERNWRYARVEIDIIASKNNVLHFIEVKTRTSTRFGLPEESVSVKKMEQLKKGAEEYQYRNSQWKDIQFDVLAINISKSDTQYWLNEDVYF